MRLIVDTHIAIWLLVADPQLPAGTAELLKDRANDVFFSVGSLWEIAIKHSLGRLRSSPKVVADGLRDSGFERLPVKDEHLACLVALPLHHRDPFDRLLIAQAEAEPMKLLTADRKLQAYGSIVMMISPPYSASLEG